jgi:hypothetical protein
MIESEPLGQLTVRVPTKPDKGLDSEYCFLHRGYVPGWPRYHDLRPLDLSTE